MNIKTLTLAAFLTLVVLHVFAQNPKHTDKKNGARTYSYTYDYSNFNPTADKDPLIKHKKDKVGVIINNINRLIFDVNATAVNRSINLQSTSIFDTLNKSLSTASAKSGASAKTLLDSSALIRPNNANAQRISELKNIIETKQSEINAKIAEISTNLVALKAFSAFAVNVPIIIGSERYSQQNIKSRILSTANQINIAYSHRLKSGTAISDSNDLSSIVNTLPIQSIATIAGDTTVVLEDMITIRKAATELHQLCPTCDLSAVNDYLEQVDFKDARAVNSGDITKAVTTLNGLLAQVNDPANFRYVSPYFYPDGDELDLSIKIQPKDQYKQTYSEDSISKRLDIKGKFEWSIGPAVNFSLSKSLFDNSYTIDSSRNEKGVAKNDTFNITQNHNQNRVVPSIGVIANFYWQLHSTVTPGITLGLSTSATDLSQVRVYIGGSLFIGGMATDNNKNLIYNHIILSGGLAYAQVNRLKGNLNLGDNPKSQIPYTGDKIATDQLTERVGKFGLYVGISYKIN